EGLTHGTAGRRVDGVRLRPVEDDLVDGAAPGDADGGVFVHVPAPASTGTTHAAGSIHQIVLEGGDHPHLLVKLGRFPHPVGVVAGQDHEHALVGAADAADGAAGIGSELLGPFARIGHRLGDHRRLYLVEAGE